MRSKMALPISPKGVRTKKKRRMTPRTQAILKTKKNPEIEA
jgi:hypothetical protein